jgi:hypothetical protein
MDTSSSHTDTRSVATTVTDNPVCFRSVERRDADALVGLYHACRHTPCGVGSSPPTRTCRPNDSPTSPTSTETIA